MVKIGEFLYFSPHCRFRDLDFNDKEKLIADFEERVCAFYINPAKLLQREPFSCGLICTATLESLARIKYAEYDKRLNEYVISKSNFVKWLNENIVEFKENGFAEKFYDDFRCGLVHEGRIKNLGQFCYENDMVYCEVDIMMVNPILLLDKTEEVLKKYLNSLREDEKLFNHFRERLAMDFGTEVEKAKSLG
jgi:hypothetical protein